MNAPANFAPLHSIESEQSVLGGLLLDPRAWDSIADMVAESDFYTEAHRVTFRRIRLLLAQNAPVDVVTVAEALDVAGESDQTGGLAYLGELASNTPSAANIKRYAEIVRDRRMRRDLLKASADIADLARLPSADPAVTLIDRAEATINALAQGSLQAEEPEAIGGVLPNVIEAIQERHDRQGEISGLRTGFADLDRLTSGLQRGDLIIVAGRPSMGKTAFALNVAENVAVDGGTALVFSLEMSKQQLTERALSSIGGIPSDALRSGRMTDGQWSGLTFALGKLHTASLIIDDSSAPSIAQMRARARRVARKYGRLDLIVVDYLQLMSGDTGRASNRNEEVSQLTRGLKLLARELQVPVIALSQLSRKVEERADKRPMMSDLRDSGSIEQDADLILMAYRDEYYHPESPFKGLAEMLIRKHRMGPLGDVHLVFQGEFSRFRDAAPDAWANAARAAREAAADAKPMRRSRAFLD